MFWIKATLDFPLFNETFQENQGFTKEKFMKK